MKNELIQEVFSALTLLVTELLVKEQPSVELMGTQARTPDGRITTTPEAFVELYRILSEAGFLPIGEGQDAPDPSEPLRILHPEEQPITGQRLRLQDLQPVSAVLKVFSLLRVRYETADPTRPPKVVVVARSDQAAEVDTLYLLGDAFTERYPVTARLENKHGQLQLILEGEEAQVGQGLSWDRGAYIRGRDASLLVRPLHNALFGAKRPLVVPRWTDADDAVIRARLPAKVRDRIPSLLWLESLHSLKETSLPLEPVRSPGTLGEHWETRSGRNGYIFWEQPIQDVLPVRRRWRRQGDPVALEDDADGQLAITFQGLGGVREIGANAYYYRFGRRGLLVDAGFDANLDGWLALPALEQLERLDAIVITHAHLDHMGSLAVVADRFPGVPIYMTLATRDILEATLGDSVNIGKMRSRKTGEAPSITEGLVTRLDRRRFHVINYGEPLDIPTIPGLKMTFHDAGHVIGSTGVELQLGGAKIFHTGDLSVEDQHLLKGMSLEPLKGHVVMEATYGAREDSTGAQRREAVGRFLDCLRERLEAGGTVLIPSFSLGRAQELFALIHDWDKKPTKPFSLYAVGGQTISINEVSKQLKRFLPKLKSDPFQWETLGIPSKAPLEERMKKAEEELRRVAAQGPAVIIATHGMLMEETGSYLLARAILKGEDARHAIFLCGYMDPRTPGFRLMHQKDREHIQLGVEDLVPKRIPKEHIQHHSLSAHGSYEELLQVAERATRSVTLVHGDEEALGKLHTHLHGLLAHKSPPVPVHVPGRGERILLERIPMPAGWEREPELQGLPAPGNSRARAKGLFLDGVTVDPLDRNRQWALIPVGQTEASLKLERGKIAEHRIEEVVVTHRHGATKGRVIYHRVKKQGRLNDLRWSEPGPLTWTVKVRSDRRVQEVEEARFSIDCGVELQPVSRVLDALDPVLELRVGGSGKPAEVKLGPQARVTLRRWEWEESSRILRLKLEPQEVGELDPLPVSVKWSGFEQTGPAIEGLRFAPRFDSLSAQTRVGESVMLTVRSSPRPVAARFGRHPVELMDGRLEVVPLKPGNTTLLLGYGLPSDPIWWEAGTLSAEAGAEVEHPSVVEVGEPVEVRVRVLPEELHGREGVLEVEGKERARWHIGVGTYTWSGMFPVTGESRLCVRVPSRGLLLWSGALEVLSGVALRTHGTLVTTADGTVVAELDWFLPKGADRTAIEQSFQQEGFEMRDWSGTTLRFTGTERSLGMREVIVGQGAEALYVPVLTLPDNQLQLDTKGTPVAGEWLEVRLAGGSLEEERPELGLTLTRVAPLIDTLSAEVEGMRVKPLHPGIYLLALLARGRRIAEHRFEVRWPRPPPATAGTRSERLELTRFADVTMRCAALPPDAPIAVLHEKGTFTVLQGTAEALEESAWHFLRQSQNEHALVISPGLALHPTSGRLLSRFWTSPEETHLARLSYPAPRGEVWTLSDSHPDARDRVRCYLPEDARIDLGDAYVCPRCSSRPTPRTVGRTLSLSCPSCDWAETRIILTLKGMLQSQARVLFTEYRMARYLMSMNGARYAGSFGRGVRCERCHAPQRAFPAPRAWEGAELRRLLAAAADAWKGTLEKGRWIQRAARRTARATRGAQAGDERRYETLLQHLVDAELLMDGQVQEGVSRLEAGRSLCCNAGLQWTPRQLRWVVLGIETLLSSAPAGLHPGLPGGTTGVSRLLALLST